MGKREKSGNFRFPAVAAGGRKGGLSGYGYDYDYDLNIKR